MKPGSAITKDTLLGQRARRWRRPLLAVVFALLLPLMLAPIAPAAPASDALHRSASDSPQQEEPASAGAKTLELPTQLPDITSRDNLGSAIQLVILLTVLSLAPAILVLCTSFTRIIIVLSLLRQALGAQNLPPNQVLAGLSLFMTCIVMGPTWGQINKEAVEPYLSGQITQQAALQRGVDPLREFMIDQIDAAQNSETVMVFMQYSRQKIPEDRDLAWGDVRTTTLIPAFVLSELKVAFLMGFKIYLPFLVIDLIISTVLISMGMMMLPPVLVSLPFKLLLFVLVDGWTLVVAGLMGSFAIASG